MSSEEYSRKIGLLCPTCGHTQFRYDEDEIMNDDCRIECISCGLSMAKAELIERNNNVIDAGVQEMKQEVVQDVKKELRKALCGVKGINIK